MQYISMHCATNYTIYIFFVINYIYIMLYYIILFYIELYLLYH